MRVAGREPLSQYLAHQPQRPDAWAFLPETGLRSSHIIPRSVSKGTRAFVLERDGYNCRVCGLAAGDSDPYNPEWTVALTVSYVINKSKGGTDDPNNLRAVCTICNEGLQNTAPPKPDRIELLRQLRRATVDDQLHLLEWLERKFKKIRPR